MLNLKQKLQCLMLAGAVIATAAFGGYVNHKDEQKRNQAIKSGELILFCNIDGYYKEISPSKFVKAEEIDGITTFYFTNGQAKQCYIEEK